MFNDTLWTLRKKKKLGTALTMLIPKPIPISGTVMWETDLILSHYSNITGATAVSGYYLLCGLQGDTETQDRQSGSLLCSVYLAKKGLSPAPPSIGITATGTKQMRLHSHVYLPSSPPHETQKAGFPHCHFTFENFLHSPKAPLYMALGVPCHSSQQGHSKPDESWHSRREVLDRSKGNLMF